MGANDRMVTQDIVLTWDGVQQPVRAGTIVDIPAGSALEAAYGLGNLVALTATDTQGDDQDLEPAVVSAGTA